MSPDARLRRALELSELSRELLRAGLRRRFPELTEAELLRYVASVPEAAGIEYTITGSIASSLQGEPRATHALDVVVAVRESDVGTVPGAFPIPGSVWMNERSGR